MTGPIGHGSKPPHKPTKPATGAMQHLLRRQDFLAAAAGLSRAARGAVVQSRNRRDAGPPRVGFTVTRKLGAAVVRNRIRRRLKEAVRISATDRLKSGFDYVFIGRAGTAGRQFGKLAADILGALDYLHAAHGDAGDAARPRTASEPGAPSQDDR